jgi:N-methylhydantoinase A/oxoprolinase/acetone carboxylase beta subunit
MIIGLDVGGTHTDVVLLDKNGIQRELKVATRASDLFQSVWEALSAVTEGIDAGSIQRIVLSTTLTTNAIARNKVAPVAMIVIAGPGIDPEHYRTNRHFYPVAGSIDHRGREIAPIRPDQIRSLAKQLQSDGIRQVGVVGKFSNRNPEHETQIEALIDGRFERVFLGHQVSGALNFGRRIATTYLNAAVYPVHKAFYAAVQQSLKKRGLDLPIRLLKADGGNMRFDASMDHPIQTVLSGPAASVMGALPFAPPDQDTIVMDIGGTTTDMAVLISQAPVLDPVGIELDRFKSLIRSLETLSIGVGGDSTVTSVDGRLRVGPDRQGPAIAYGGSLPTPTDALAAMGDIEALDAASSRSGLAPLARELGWTVDRLAKAIVEKSCQQIIGAAGRLVDRINSKPVYTVHELQEGYVVNPSHILVLGGPAPYFAPYLKKHSKMTVTVVPRWKVANAIGAALARTTCEVTLLADSERGIAAAHEEKFSTAIDRSYDLKAAEQQALELLRAKAIARGANPDYLEMETVEGLAFNIVRGFNTTGRNIRVRVQVKPGLIHGYDEMIAGLAAGK